MELSMQYFLNPDLEHMDSEESMHPKDRTFEVRALLECLLCVVHG